MKKLSVIGAISVLAAGIAQADEFTPAMQEYLEAELSGWASDTAFVSAINAQNAQTGGYDQSRIDELDLQWRAEVGTGSTPTITPVMENALAEVLRERVAAAGGRITEVFVMDAQGLNVAASDVTSDYWQGDEAKFQETYGRGPGSHHFGEVEFDESTQTYQGQISMTIVDPSSGQAIGAVTVGVDAESLM